MLIDRRLLAGLFGFAFALCSMSSCSNGESTGLRVLVLGDSISWSAQGSAATGSGWGKSASAPELDWVHLVAQALPAEVLVPTSARLCGDDHGFLDCPSLLARFAEWQPDVVITQVSEHHGLLDGFREDADVERWHRRVADFAAEQCAQLIAIGRWDFVESTVERSDALVRRAIAPHGELIELTSVVRAPRSLEGSKDRWHPGDHAHKSIALRVTQAILQGSDRRGCAPGT